MRGRTPARSARRSHRRVRLVPDGGSGTYVVRSESDLKPARRTSILAPVERRVQERLVGAAVLMAAAIILIPEMLSGPRRGERAVTGQPSSDAPLKTYTIDLNRSPGAASS